MSCHNNYTYCQNAAGAMQNMKLPDTNQMYNGMQAPQARMLQNQTAARGATVSPLTGTMPDVPGSMRYQDTTHRVPPESPYISSLPSRQRNMSPLAMSMPAMPSAVETPPTVESPYYTAGFLRNFLGKDMRVEFLLGTNGLLTDRTGTLLEVGASYIVIQPWLTDDLLMCDLYSIKFVQIYA